LTGKLLPTGNTTDALEVKGEGKFEVSLVDAGIPVVFIHAEAPSLKERKTPQEIDPDKKLLISDVKLRKRSKT
jgi:2-methylaconitate cis-trans-isomerase PrpF